MGLCLWVWFGGLWDFGGDCGLWGRVVHVRGKNGALCGCFGGNLGRVGLWWEIRPGNCPICENLSTFQNSQNFVNFHLSKIKGGTLSNPALG